LFRFGNVGSFCQTPHAGASEPVAGPRPTPHCYSLLFSLFFIVICAAWDAGRIAQGRAAQGEIRPCVQRRIVISLLLTMARVSRASR
jgi:hypothetical protein